MEIIIIDTNVLLNLYDLNPQIGTDIILFLENKIDSVWIPCQIKEELSNKRKKATRGAKSRTNNFKKDMAQIIDEFKSKAETQMTMVASYQYPKIKEIKEEFFSKVEDLSSFYENRINSYNAGGDKVDAYINHVNRACSV